MCIFTGSGFPDETKKFCDVSRCHLYNYENDLFTSFCGILITLIIIFNKYEDKMKKKLIGCDVTS